MKTPKANICTIMKVINSIVGKKINMPRYYDNVKPITWFSSINTNYCTSTILKYFVPYSVYSNYKANIHRIVLFIKSNTTPIQIFKSEIFTLMKGIVLG